jgi:hypothetical protein
MVMNTIKLIVHKLFYNPLTMLTQEHQSIYHNKEIKMKTKQFYLYSIPILALLLSIPVASKDDFFTGTWCIGDERLIITFTGKDSLRVTSMKDETINGSGTYEKKDSTLIATLLNDDLELKMGYRYKQKSSSRVRAKIIFFTVDGDSVNHPNRWMRMERCDPESFKFPDDGDEDKEE